MWLYYKGDIKKIYDKGFDIGHKYIIKDQLLDKRNDNHIVITKIVDKYGVDTIFTNHEIMMLFETISEHRNRIIKNII